MADCPSWLARLAACAQHVFRTAAAACCRGTWFAAHVCGNSLGPTTGGHSRHDLMVGPCHPLEFCRYAASIDCGMDAQQEELFWQVLDTMREWGACPNATRRALASPLEHRRADVVALCPIRQAGLCVGCQAAHKAQ